MQPFENKKVERRHNANPKKVFIRGVSASSTAESLENYLQLQYGALHDLCLLRKGCALVTFVDEAAAKKAMADIKRMVDGSQLQVE